MALSAPVLLVASSTTTPSNPHATASISPTANTAGIIVVVCSRNPATTISVAAGAGLDLGTITSIETQTYGTIASPTRRISAWWYTGAASPGSGAINITQGASSSGLAWIVLEMPNMDRTAPIIASATNRADNSTGITVTLDDVGGTLTWDGTLGFFANGDAANSITIGGSFTNIAQLSVASSNSFRLRGEYALSKLTAVDCTQTSTHLCGVAFGVIQVAAAPSSTIPTNFFTRDV